MVTVRYLWFGGHSFFGPHKVIVSPLQLTESLVFGYWFLASVTSLPAWATATTPTVHIASTPATARNLFMLPLSWFTPRGMTERPGQTFDRPNRNSNVRRREKLTGRRPGRQRIR